MRPDEAIARLTGWEEIFLEEGDEDEKAHADDLRAVLDYISSLEQRAKDNFALAQLLDARLQAVEDAARPFAKQSPLAKRILNIVSAPSQPGTTSA